MTCHSYLCIIFMRYTRPNMVIMPTYGFVFQISICKLDVICINSGSRHVILAQNVLCTCHSCTNLALCHGNERGIDSYPIKQGLWAPWEVLPSCWNTPMNVIYKETDWHNRTYTASKILALPNNSLRHWWTLGDLHSIEHKLRTPPSSIPMI